MASILQLECSCNSYPWGKQGKDSLAARYAAAAPGTQFELDTSKPYAEMWMGTYPTTPSLILRTHEDLQQHLEQNQERLIGRPVLDRFGTKLPFLPKVLSIAKALPLQIHPGKALASKLHAKNPDKFGDDNHKPEIAVALSTFETFVGWKPYEDIESLLQGIAPLRTRFLKESKGKFDFSALKILIADILRCSDLEIERLFETLRNEPIASFGTQKHIPELLPRLAKQYGESDPGILIAVLTMNFLILEKGQAIFVPADGIHAYLSGDIIECMARSDNVLDTGFCPRGDRDNLDLFVDALTFEPSTARDAILEAQTCDKGELGNTTMLRPPMSEFNMLTIQFQAGGREKLQALQGPGVMVVTKGGGALLSNQQTYYLKEGYVFFIGFDTKLEIDAEEDFTAYVAYCEV